MCENLEDFYRDLKDIEFRIDSCIENSSEFVKKLKYSSRFLEDVLNEHHQLAAQKAEKEQQQVAIEKEVDGPKAIDQPIIQENRTLDDILQQARQLRTAKLTRIDGIESESSNPKAISNSSKTKLSPDKKKKVASKALISLAESQAHTIRITHNKAQIPSQQPRLIRHVEEVKEYVKPGDAMTVRFHMMMDEFHRSADLCKIIIPVSLDTELLQLKSSILSKVTHGCRSLPMNGLYHALLSTILIDECDDDDDEKKSMVVNRSSIETLKILSAMIRQERINYDKKLKPRILRFKVHELDHDDCIDLFRIWYKLRRIHDMIETIAIEIGLSNDIIDSSDNIDANGGESMDNMISRFLDDIPLSCTSISSHHHRATSSLEQNLSRIDDNYKALESRVQYLIEAVIAKYLLKHSISSLKQCCQQSYASTDTPHPTAIQAEAHKQWKAALSMYRDLYTCLSERGRDYHGCMFLEKTS